MKTFHVTERVGFTLRTDATNVFNHTNLGSPERGRPEPHGRPDHRNCRRRQHAAAAILGQRQLLI